ncbi:MAG: AraC family transcriptional regulator [Lewinellaceae bacterium]|nr:AraC family transcriptional regulator [Lewinellaceae bacterium]
MLLKDFLPHPGLQEFVRCYRIIHLDLRHEALSGVKPYTPRPEICLAFYPQEREEVFCTQNGQHIKNIPVALVGQATHLTQRHVQGNFLAIQILFKPGGFFRLTGIPSPDINNSYLEADLVFGPKVHEVNERFYFAHNYLEIAHIANDFVLSLAKNLKKDFHPVDTIGNLLLYQPKMSLNTMARGAFLSIKQFDRKFKERNGINPKLFSRLARFDQTFREKNLSPNRDWTQIAYACDYYDYQHLVLDYLDFTGMKPTQFYQMELGAPERKFGLAEHYYDSQII